MTPDKTTLSKEVKSPKTAAEFKALLDKTMTQSMYAESLATSGNFRLSQQDRGLINDSLIVQDYFAFFSSGLTISNNVGSIIAKWNIYRHDFVDKTPPTRGKQIAQGIVAPTGDGIYPNNLGFNRPEWAETYHKWNQPQIYKEAMWAYDLKKGIPNVLAERMSLYVRKFTRDSMVTAAQTLADNARNVLIIAPVANDTQKNGLKIIKAIADEVTKLAQKSYYLKPTIDATGLLTAVTYDKAGINPSTGRIFADMDVSDFKVIIEQTYFNDLALAGVIGDRVTQTLASGTVSFGTIFGGIQLIAVPVFMPIAVKADATGMTVVDTAGTVSSGAAVTGKTVTPKAIISHSKALIHATDIIAANAGMLPDLSSDQGTYLEMCNIISPTVLLAPLTTIITDKINA